MKPFSNISKAILLTILVTILIFLNFAYADHGLRPGAIGGGSYSDFHKNELGIFLLFLSSITFLFNKSKFGKGLGTMGIALLFNYCFKFLIAYNSEKEAGLGYLDENLPSFYYSIIATLSVLLVYINLNFKNQQTTPKSKTKLIGTVIMVVLFVLSHLNFMLY